MVKPPGKWIKAVLFGNKGVLMQSLERFFSKCIDAIRYESDSRLNKSQNNRDSRLQSFEQDMEIRYESGPSELKFPQFKQKLQEMIMKSINEEQKKRVAEEEVTARKMGHGARLLPTSKEDFAAGKRVKFSSKFNKNKDDKQALIKSASIFSDSSFSSSSKRMECETK